MIEELTIAAPAGLPARGALQLQVSVGEADADGRRGVAIFSRPQDGAPEWTRNASGTLVASQLADPPALDQWPPPGAEPLGLEGFYEQAGELGLDYGPAFQGLRAAWRRGPELFAEVELGPEQAAEAERYALHPALLDAALHSHLLADGDGQAGVPFSFRGLALHRAGAAAARVRL